MGVSATSALRTGRSGFLDGISRITNHPGFRNESNSVKARCPGPPSVDTALGDVKVPASESVSTFSGCWGPCVPHFQQY
jgi:hypothetical protein